MQNFRFCCCCLPTEHKQWPLRSSRLTWCVWSSSISRSLILLAHSRWLLSLSLTLQVIALSLRIHFKKSKFLNLKTTFIYISLSYAPGDCSLSFAHSRWLLSLSLFRTLQVELLKTCLTLSLFIARCYKRRLPFPSTLSTRRTRSPPILTSQ